MPNEQFFSYIMARTIYIKWDDNEVCPLCTRSTHLVGLLLRYLSQTTVRM